MVFWYNKLRRDYPYVKNTQIWGDTNKNRYKNLTDTIKDFSIRANNDYGGMKYVTYINYPVGYSARARTPYEEDTIFTIDTTSYGSVNTERARNIARVYFLLSDIMDDIKITYPELPDYLMPHVYK